MLHSNGARCRDGADGSNLKFWARRCWATAAAIGLCTAAVVIAYPTGSSASSGGEVPLNSASFGQRVTVGHGFVEASARQVVRTSDDFVYIITADDSTNPASIHVWKGSPAGIPTSFTEMDAAHRPTAYKIGSPDTRLDRSGMIHIAYNDETNHTLYYQTFNTATDTWGVRTALATNAETGLANGSTLDRTGNVAIILDGNDDPNIAYTTTSNTVVYVPSNGTSGGFGTPQTVATGTLPIHPALAMDGTGAVDLTWADNTAALGCKSCSTTSPSTRIMFAQCSPGGVWSTPEVVGTKANSNIYLDQSPNIVVDSGNIPYVTYIFGSPDYLEIARRTSPGTWVNDSPASSAYSGYVHDPSLYSAGKDVYAIPGHDGKTHFGYFYELGGDGNTWSPWVLLDSTQNDGSPSIRWDPARDNDPRVIDMIYFNEKSPTTLYYVAVQPQGAAGTGPDTTAPSVAITSQPANPSNSTNPSFSFAGNDNFTPPDPLTYTCTVDGGAATPCSSPFTASSLSSGAHTFSVQATDQAGNVSAPASYGWTIDTTPPSAPGNPTASASSPTQVALSWTASSDASGIAGYRISRNGGLLATVGNVTSYVDSTAAPSTSYTYTVTATDAAGNVGPASSGANVTTPADPPDTTPPSVPIGLHSTAVSTSSVSLAWTASADDPGGSGVGGYYVYRNGTEAGHTTGTSYTDTGLSPSTKYSYTVAAEDNAGNESAQSSSLPVTTASASSGTLLLGSQTVASGSDSNSAGRAEAFKTTAVASGTDVTMEMYVTSGSSLDIGLYAANGSHPGTLLAQANDTQLTTGAWNKVALPASAITAGTTYWIAILAPHGASSLGFRDAANAGASETSASASLTSLPATWSTGTTYTDGSLSAYGTS